MDATRILLIDDEPYVRDVVRNCLLKTDYALDAPAVEEPGVAPLAVNDALSGSYQVVLLDLHIPTMDAYDLLERLMSPDTPTEPVIVAAFLPDPIRNAIQQRHQCYRFVEKPFTFSELMSEIDACVEAVA